MFWNNEPTFEERQRRQYQRYDLRQRGLEVQAVEQQLEAARLDNERRRIEIENARLSLLVTQQDIMQRAYLTQSAALDVELKRRDLELLYPNQMGAYPVHLNPNPEWKPLYLPAANGKYTPEQEPPPPPKPFSELLRDGTVNWALSQNKIVLGYTKGELRYGSWLDLYSCAIGGVSGSGKTTTVRFLLFQACLAGSKFIMIDPHIGDEEESLAAQFRGLDVHLFEPCGDYPSQILERVRFLTKELDRRKREGIKGPSIVLIIDEFNAAMRDEQVSDAIARLLVAIAQEGRKFGLFAMLIGQRWSSQDIGGAEIRTSLASTLVHRFVDKDQATKLLGDGREATKTLKLHQGHYLFRDTDGQLCEMVTPNTVATDGEYIRELLSQTTESSSKVVESSLVTEPLKPVRNQFETSTESSMNEPVASIAGRIIQMQAKGFKKAEIMRAIWNVSPGGGERYEQAKEEYKQAMGYIAEKLGVTVNE